MPADSYGDMPTDHLRERIASYAAVARVAQGRGRKAETDVAHAEINHMLDELERRGEVATS